MQNLQPNTTLQGGKYRIERMLGQGGFGITYLAILTSSNQQVAIKELFLGGSGQAINDRRGNQVIVTNLANQASFKQQKEKFKKEALRLANLNHPNLVKVHEFFEENGTAYYVMNYIEGESLRTKMNREGALSESLVLRYMQQLLPALEAAHKQSIWHLDIKPENIMVDRYGHVYLIDFGASKHVEPNSTLTTSLALAYTPGYCPPELLDLSNETPEYYLQAIKDIGPWTDIYALGATIYNLLTDSIPPSKRRLDKEGRNAFSFPSNISSSTQDLIVWMMKPDREDRLQSIEEVSSSILNSNDISEISNPILEPLTINDYVRVKKGFKLRNECGEYVIVAEGKENIDFSNIITMNESSAYLWNTIQDKEAFNANYLAKLLTEEYVVDRETALIDSMNVIKQWYKSGIIEKNSASITHENTIVESLSINGNMRVKKGFILRNVCGEKVIANEGKENVDFNNIITLNESAAYLWNIIQHEEAFNADYLAKLLTTEYDIDIETALMDAKNLIKQWYKAGIIEETSASIRFEADETTKIKEKDSSYSKDFSTTSASNSGCIFTFILSVITTIVISLLK